MCHTLDFECRSLVIMLKTFFRPLCLSQASPNWLPLTNVRSTILGISALYDIIMSQEWNKLSEAEFLEQAGLLAQVKTCIYDTVERTRQLTAEAQTSDLVMLFCDVLPLCGSVWVQRSYLIAVTEYGREDSFQQRQDMLVRLKQAAHLLQLHHLSVRTFGD